MNRSSIDLREFGLTISKEQFISRIVGAFQKHYDWSIDELLLRPREAARFCDEIRTSLKSYDIPDDIILAVLISQRKQGKLG